MVAIDTSFMERQANRSAAGESGGSAPNRLATISQSEPCQSGSWIAASGGEHHTQIETVEHFQLLNDRIYILVHFGRSLWVGTNQDLIEDQTSRQRFQIALRTATHVHSLRAPSDPTKRLCVNFDLDAGFERTNRSAA